MMASKTDFSKMKVAELKAECTERGLSTAGKKDDLIQRLNDSTSNSNNNDNDSKKNKLDDNEQDQSDVPSVKKQKVDTSLEKWFNPVGGSAKKSGKEEDTSNNNNSGKSTEMNLGEDTIGVTNSILDHLTEPTWRKALSNEVKKPYFKSILSFLEKEKKAGKEVFPPENEIFSAFNHTPLDKIKVVIIGQDPYHDNNQAHGLCFSVKKGIKTPPSLKNIYKELSATISGFKAPDHGFLQSWADHGVFMLNATLTVEAHKANSHEGIGWQTFTDEVIRIIDANCTGVVFLNWGKFAQKKASIIKRNKAYIVNSPHPSPLAKGFVGCGCFKKADELLKSAGKEPVDWNLPKQI